MASYEISKEWIARNGEKIKEAYSSAKARNLDITSNEDMLQLLTIIDPINATNKNAIILSKLLQLMSHFFKKEIKKRYSQNRKIQKKIIN